MNDNELGDLREAEERSRELINKGRFAEALAVLNEAESKGLQSGELSTNQVLTLINLKRWPEASSLVEESLKEYPEEPDLYYAKALLLNRQIRPEEALATCEEAASLGLWNGRLASATAGALARVRRRKEVAPYVKQQLQLYPDEPLLHFQLGGFYMANWKWKAANREFKTAVRSIPALKKKVRTIEAFYGSLGLFMASLVAMFLISPSSRYAWAIPFLFLDALIVFVLARARRLGILRLHKRLPIALIVLFLLLAWEVLIIFVLKPDVVHFPESLTTAAFLALILIGTILLVRQRAEKRKVGLMTWYKRAGITIACLFVLILIIGAFSLSKSGGTKDALALANKYLQAVQSKDIDSYVDCFDPDYFEKMIGTPVNAKVLARAMLEVQNIKFSGVKLEVQSQDEDHATVVTTTGNMSSNTMGYLQANNDLSKNPLDFNMIKKNNRWYLTADPWFKIGNGTDSSGSI